MSARSGLVGENSSWPHLVQFQAHFSMGQKNAKTCPKLAYFPWWANGPYSPGLGSSSQQQGFPRGSISSLSALGGAWIWI